VASATDSEYKKSIVTLIERVREDIYMPIEERIRRMEEYKKVCISAGWKDMVRYLDSMIKELREKGRY